MNSSHRKILAPVGLKKRKERESLPSAQPPPAPAQPTPRPQHDNRLLAGYMAYEFLTRGTLLGQRFDPPAAEGSPVGPPAAEAKRTKPEARSRGEEQNGNGYAEVASILKTEGTHIPGIVNPTQLARWIQM